MNKNIKIGLLAGGIVAGVASMMPLTTYADTAGDGDVAVGVPKNITLDIVGTNNVALTADPTKVVTADLSAKVITNAGYTISINASSAAATALTGTSGSSIPTVTTTQPTAGQNIWGIKKKVDNTTDATDYSGVTTSITPFYSTDTGTVADGVTTTFTVGVSIAPTLPSGSYSTTITVTAANK